jgi:two-component system, NarL family, response regulator LiaR
VCNADSKIEAGKPIQPIDHSLCLLILAASPEQKATILAALPAGVNASTYELPSRQLTEVIKTIQDHCDYCIPDMAHHDLIPVASIKQNVLSHSCESKLSKREREVLQLLSEGKSNSAIAAALGITPHTAKAHVKNIFEKLLVSDRVQAAVKAVKEGLL